MKHEMAVKELTAGFEEERELTGKAHDDRYDHLSAQSDAKIAELEAQLKHIHGELAGTQNALEKERLTGKLQSE